MLTDLNENQVRLAKYMSELSEIAYTASWIDGLEYILWNALDNKVKVFGRLTFTKEIKVKLKSLSENTEGWILFDENNEETFVD